MQKLFIILKLTLLQMIALRHFLKTKDSHKKLNYFVKLKIGTENNNNNNITVFNLKI